MEQVLSLSLLDQQNANIISLAEKLKRLGIEANLRLTNQVTTGDQKLSGFYQTAVVIGKAAELLAYKFAFTQIKSVRNQGEDRIDVIKIRSPIKTKLKYHLKFDRPTLIIDCRDGRMWGHLSPGHSISDNLFNFEDYGDGKKALFQLLLYMGISLSEKRGQFEERRALEKVLKGEFSHSYPQFSNDILPLLTDITNNSLSVNKLERGWQMPKKKHWWIVTTTQDETLLSAKVFNARQVRVGTPSFQRDEIWVTVRDRKADLIELKTGLISDERVVTELELHKESFISPMKAKMDSGIHLKLFQIPEDLVKRAMYYATPHDALKAY